jgi:Kef-type K+ transport system membrane component KefB
VTRRVVALGIVLIAALLARRAAGDTASTGTVFALGFALIAASLAGEILERARLPRVTGYLLFGLACGPYVGDIITRNMARDLQTMNGLAVVLIALVAGLEINLPSLRDKLVTLIRFSAVLLAILFAAIFGLFWLAWPWLGIAPDATGLQRAAMIAVLATLTVSFSPTVTMAVVAESRASGQFTEFLVAFVVLADLALILGFTLVMQAVRAIFDATAGGDIGLFAHLAWEIPGSLAFGALVGALFALYLTYVSRELTVVLIAVCTTISLVGSALHFEPVLAALAAGLVVENIAPPQGVALRDSVERGSMPVLIVFFAAAGASIQLDALAAIGIVALGLAVARSGLLVVATEAATRVSGLDREVGAVMWMGLVSQAGVTLGLTYLVAKEFPEWGAPMQTLMLSLIALHQLVGPALLKLALKRVGDADRQYPVSGQTEPLHAE